MFEGGDGRSPVRRTDNPAHPRAYAGRYVN